jgi:hypothetical protein
MGRRWFLRPYISFMDTWLHYGKPALSEVSALLRLRDPVDLDSPFVFTKIREQNPATLDALAAWLAEHTEWLSDPLGGLLDFFPTAENIEWQFNHSPGIFRDDCDGLAYLTALCVRPFCDDPAKDYLATVVYDPTEVPVEGSAHVLNLFRHQGSWRVFSNAELDAQAWETPCAALYDNSYYHCWCHGARLRHIEVRDANLGLLAAGLGSCSALFGCNLDTPSL